MNDYIRTVQTANWIVDSRGGRGANECNVTTLLGSEMRVAAAHVGIIVTDT